MKLTLLERETIIDFNEQEQTANIYTHNAALQRQLDALADQRPDDCKISRRNSERGATDYTIPKGWIKVRPPRRLSPAQLEAAKSALAKTRKSV